MAPPGRALREVLGYCVVETQKGVPQKADEPTDEGLP